MSQSLLEHQEALDLLEPHLTAIGRCNANGWKSWESIRKAHPTMSPHFSKRSRASIVYDMTIAQAAREFPGTEGGPRLVKGRGGLLMLEIDGRIRLRFKRMRPNLATSSIMTRQQMQLNMQIPIPGLAPATVATVGYITNIAETGIERKLVVCRLNAVVLWVIEIPEASAEVIDSVTSHVQPPEPAIDPPSGVIEGTIEIGQAEPGDS